MKNVLILFSLISISLNVTKAQNSVRTLKGLEVDTAIFNAAEIEPIMPRNFGPYMFKSMQQIDKSRVQSGSLLLKFIVEKDGSLSNIRVIKGLSPYCDSEAIRMLRGSPKWKPAMNNNKIVRCWYTAPLAFAK
jgi:protein TonB